MSGRLLSILILVLSVSASPVLTRNPDGPVCLAVLLCICLLLAALVVLKRVFIRRRRAAVLGSKPFRGTSTANSSTTIGSGLRLSVNSLRDNSGKAGLWVGFLGSPVFETRLKQDSNKVVLKDLELSSSLGYQLHTKSRRRRTYMGSFTFQEMWTTSTRLASSLSGTLRRDTLDSPSEQHGGSFAQLPSYPKKVQIGSRMSRGCSIHKADLCQDIPSRTRSNSFGTRTGQQSVKTTTNLASKNTPLRLVEGSTVLSLPAPRPPPSDLPAALSSALPASTVDTSIRLLPPAVTSAHPINHLIQSTQTRRSVHPSGNSSDHSGNKILDPPPPSRPPLGQTNHTVGRSAPLRAKLSPTMTSSPFYPQPSTSSKFHRREVGVRKRKVSAPGPSPLRIMTLPESFHSERDLRMAHLSSADKENWGPRDRVDSDQKLSRSRRRVTCAIEETGQQESNMLLGIIQDLIEEAREWDPGLFMDENFRLLIQTRELPGQAPDVLDRSTYVAANSSETLITAGHHSSGEEPSSVEGTNLFNLWQQDPPNDEAHLDTRENVGLAL